ARYVAELGLHHAMTLMHRSGDRLLKDARRDDYTTTLEIDSTGRVTALKGEDVANSLNVTPPNLASEAGGGRPLGQLGGLVPSYRVRIDGFKFLPRTQANDAKAALSSGEGDCIMHFSARGYIADKALPTDEELSDDERFADFVLKAAAPMPAYANHCKRWNP
ncbi:hypothetical protein KKF91_05085, partial [Myxococcota bacterium]|nr:hypothetical protein [Myxococcota bacterium]